MPAAAQAIIEAFRMLEESTEYTDRLWANARYFKRKLSGLGFDLGKSETPITPIIIGDEERTMAFSKRLFEHGVFVSGIVFPTVPKGRGRIRCMVSALHEKEHLDRALSVIERVACEMQLI